MRKAKVPLVYNNKLTEPDLLLECVMFLGRAELWGPRPFVVEGYDLSAPPSFQFNRSFNNHLASRSSPIQTSR
jgi:hypothetical protein